MLLMLFALAVAGVTAYIWCIRGFFSALIHMVCVIAAAAIAFGVWEPVAYLLINNAPERGFGSSLPDMSWGLALAVPFAVSLAVLRAGVDKLLPANAQCEPVADYIGGGVCGAVSGVISAGVLVLSLNLIRAEPDFMGYQPVVFTTGVGRGSIERTPDKFIPWVDRLAAGLYSHLSLTTFRTAEPLARWHPDFDTFPGSLRLTYEGRSRYTLRPDAFKIENYYVVGDPQRPQKLADLMVDDMSEGVVQKASTLDGKAIGQGATPPETEDEPDLTQGYLAGFTVKFNSKAKETPGQVVVGNGQVRLVVQRDDDDDNTVALHPIAVVTNVDDPTKKAFAHFRYNADNTYTASVGGAADAVMAFEFPVPARYKPLALYIKGVRVDLTERFDKPTATFSDPSQRDEAIRSGQMASMTDVGPILDANGKPLEAPAQQGFQVPLIQVSNTLGFTLQKGQETGLEVVQETRGYSVQAGDQTLRNNSLKGLGAVDPKLKIDRFASTSDTSVVKVAVTPKYRDADFNKLYEQADRNAEPALIDSTGTRYTAVGWIYKDPAVTKIRYDRGHPVQRLGEAPAVSRSSPDKELTLVFVVSAGVQITEFKIGDVTLGDFSKTPIKADATGRR